MLKNKKKINEGLIGFAILQFLKLKENNSLKYDTSLGLKTDQEVYQAIRQIINNHTT